MRRLAAVLALLVALPALADLPCDSEYRALLGEVTGSDRWKLEQAWSVYATGEPESSDGLRAAAMRARVASPRRPSEERRSLIRCLGEAPPVAVVAFQVRTVTRSNGATQTMSGVPIFVDGRFVAITDGTGTVDLTAPPRQHVVTAVGADWAQPVSRLLDLSAGAASPLEIDLSRNHAGDGGNYSVSFTQLDGNCGPFAIEYFQRYAPAAIGNVERALVVTPEANVVATDFFVIGAGGSSVIAADCRTLMARLDGLAPPFVLYVRARAADGTIYEQAEDVRRGPHHLTVNTRGASGGSVSLRRADSYLPTYVPIDGDGVARFDQIAPGDYVVESLGGVIAREHVRVERDETVDLYFLPWRIEDVDLRSTAPGAAREREGERDAHVIMFQFDATGTPRAAGYWRQLRQPRELPRASQTLVDAAQRMNSYDPKERGFVEARLVDSKGRLTHRTLGEVYLLVRLPGGGPIFQPIEGRSFLVTLPAGYSKRLTLRGWLPSMNVELDLDALIRDLTP